LNGVAAPDAGAAAFPAVGESLWHAETKAATTTTMKRISLRRIEDDLYRTEARTRNEHTASAALSQLFNDWNTHDEPPGFAYVPVLIAESDRDYRLTLGDAQGVADEGTILDGAFLIDEIEVFSR